MQSFRIRQIRNSIKRPVQYTVSIDQYDFISHQILSYYLLLFVAFHFNHY